MKDGCSIQYRLVRTLLGFSVIASLAVSCSMPSLEPASCTDARPLIREFYSFHFANEMELTPDGLQRRARFISDRLKNEAAQQPEGKDPFTIGTGAFPRAFRVGSCQELSEGQVEFDVLLFWKEETTTEQRPIKVELIKENGQWLVDRVNN